MRKLIVFFFFITSSVHAGYEKSLQQRAADTARTTSPTSLPGFVTSTPSETELANIDALEAAGEKAIFQNKHAQDLQRMAETRPYFVIDGKKDPLIRNAQKAVRDPRKFLKSPMQNRIPSQEYEIKTCRESKPATEYKCQSSLIAPEIHIEPAKYSHYWCTSGMHRPDDTRCRAKRYYNPARKYKDEVVRLTKERWTNTCSALQEKVRAGLCRLVKTVCPKGSETRRVTGPVGTTGKTESRPLTKDCWRYEYTYQCNAPSPNTCAALRTSSCEQIGSKCLNKIGEECIEWEQTYRCPSKKSIKELKLLSQKGFKLPKSTTFTSSQPNTEMNDALSKLSILSEIQHEIRQSPTAKSVTVFRGETRKCTVAFAGFKNCCTNGKGWGVSLSLTGCDAEEQDLAKRQSQGLCVTLGTYCAEKVLGVCTRKKRSACCFPSKLARLLHEQGRAQLGIGWGDAEHPDCRGFTAEELSRINFDRLNLSEIFTDIVTRTKQVSSAVVKRNLSDRITEMTTHQRED